MLHVRCCTDQSVEFERLRKTVVQHVRQNELAEQYVDQLDIKIALLVKNKITLDEVVKHQKHFGGHVGTLLSSKDISSKDPFDLKALNKTSRRKLEQYQELFFTLQTQPQYLARLFRRVREQRLEEKDTKRIEQLTMSMFGLAQKRREEYWLLKLMSRSLREEIDGCAALQEFTRGNFFWTKLFNSFVRSPRDRKFLKELLGTVIRDNIIDNEELDLESDPMQIYKSAINNEELRTGQQSRRDPNVTRDMALKDQETRATFIHNLQDLRDVADQYFSMLEEVLHRMPYGVRYITQQMFEELRQKFPYEPQEQLLQVAGHWLWRSYIQPALAQPQHWGVVDRGLSNVMGRNLNAVNKVLGQIAAGRLFGGEDLYLQPLNSYVTEAIDRLQDIWVNLIDVRDAEAYFEIDEFNDLFARTKPTLYIKLADVFAIHNLVINDLSTLCPSQDDPLREVVRELGSAKNNENELLHVSSTEITLTLNPKFHEQEGKHHDRYALSKADSTRPRRTPQVAVHGNQALRIVYYPRPDWCQPHRDLVQACHTTGRRSMGRTRTRRACGAKEGPQPQAQCSPIISRFHIHHRHGIQLCSGTRLPYIEAVLSREHGSTPTRWAHLASQQLPGPAQCYRGRHPHQAQTPYGARTRNGRRAHHARSAGREGALPRAAAEELQRLHRASHGDASVEEGQEEVPPALHQAIQPHARTQVHRARLPLRQLQVLGAQSRTEGHLGVLERLPRRAMGPPRAHHLVQPDGHLRDPGLPGQHDDSRRVCRGAARRPAAGAVRQPPVHELVW